MLGLKNMLFFLFRQDKIPNLSMFIIECINFKYSFIIKLFWGIFEFLVNNYTILEMKTIVFSFFFPKQENTNIFNIK